MVAYLLERIRYIPLPLLLLIALLSCYGLIMLYAVAGGYWNPWASKQLLHLLTLLPLFIGLWFIDLRYILKCSYLIYALALLILLAVGVSGTKVMGAKRWISIAGLRFQPAEPMKIAVVLALARYFHPLKIHDITRVKFLLPPLVLILIPAIIVIKQPDLGTGMILLLTGVGILLVAGMKFQHFLIAIFIVALAAPLGWSKLHNYQKQRLIVFLDPETDPLGSGYNIIQSKIAIGSGGFFGKGLGQGTQSQLDFLPEAHTDFIFACIAEDLGLLGSLLLIALYGLTIIINLVIASHAKSNFAKLLASGVTIIFFCHIFINLGMVSGILPVVGVPLPFISYGGASIASLLIGFGLIINIQINGHRKI